MTYTVIYHTLAVDEDIPKLDTAVKKQIRLAIEKKLMTHPDIFGVPLRRSLTGYRKLRVGDWRVIFRIEARSVKIFIIGHRSIVYKAVEGRGIIA